MHDVENHTVCYLRDVLVTRAHRDPEVTSFLTLWNYEEFWHGEAIAAILAAHDEPSGRAGSPRSASGSRGATPGSRSASSWHRGSRPISPPCT